jgi:hypothetical protein
MVMFELHDCTILRLIEPLDLASNEAHVTIYMNGKDKNISKFLADDHGNFAARVNVIHVTNDENADIGGCTEYDAWVEEVVDSEGEALLAVEFDMDLARSVIQHLDSTGKDHIRLLGYRPMQMTDNMASVYVNSMI